jgi:hypothetical protein
MKWITSVCCGLAVASLLAGSANAQFSEGFDDSSADVKIVKDADAEVFFVDYSNFTVGSTTHSIPEAPRMIGGSAPTRGILIQANHLVPRTDTVTSNTASAANVLAGATPLVFSGDYRLSFDAYLSVAVPVPSGGTEQLLWGTGSADDGDLEARYARANSEGIWGYLATENGYGSEDATIRINDALAANLGDTTTPGPFNNAFTTNFGSANAPGNSWVRVDVYVRDGISTNVHFNDVPFLSVPVSAPAGAALLGYEDAFSSISAGFDHQWGLFDNFTVTSIPEPASASLIGLGLVGVGLVRRRK